MIFFTPDSKVFFVSVKVTIVIVALVFGFLERSLALFGISSFLLASLMVETSHKNRFNISSKVRMVIVLCISLAVFLRAHFCSGEPSAFATWLHAIDALLGFTFSLLAIRKALYH